MLHTHNVLLSKSFPITISNKQHCSSFRWPLKKELCHNREAKRKMKGFWGYVWDTDPVPTNQGLNYSREERGKGWVVLRDAVHAGSLLTGHCGVWILMEIIASFGLGMCSSGKPTNACKNKSWEMVFEGHLIFNCECVYVLENVCGCEEGIRFLPLFCPADVYVRTCFTHFWEEAWEKVQGRYATYNPNFCLLVLRECIKSCCEKPRPLQSPGKGPLGQN